MRLKKTLPTFEQKERDRVQLLHAVPVVIVRISQLKKKEKRSQHIQTLLNARRKLMENSARS